MKSTLPKCLKCNINDCIELCCCRQSKRMTTLYSKPRRKWRKGIPLYIPKRHDNLQMIKKCNLWRAMINSVLKGHSIKKIGHIQINQDFECAWSKYANLKFFKTWIILLALCTNILPWWPFSTVYLSILPLIEPVIKRSILY